jgi:hypothetical protein
VPPTTLGVLRHALADPLSAATAKAEVLAARLSREAPALAERARDLGADLATAGRLLDLLAALSDIEEEAPETTPLGRIVAPFEVAVENGTDRALVRARPASAGDAIRRVVAFGTVRGGVPAITLRRGGEGAEVVVRPLGSPPTGPLERLLLLPRELPGAEDIFIAHAALTADGGTLTLSVDGAALAATLCWPAPLEEP